MLSRTYGRIFLLQLCKAIEPPEEGLSFVLLCGPSSCIWGIYIGWKKKKLQKAPLTLTANSEPLVVTCKVEKRESNSAIDLLT